jgi:hypothetical protein
MTRRRALIWAAIMTLLSIVLAFVPVWNVIGYELAFTVGIVASFGAADLAAAHASALRARGTLPVWTVWSGAAARAVPALLAPPLVVMAANALRVDPCDPARGLVFYALLPLASTLCAASAGTVAGLLLPRRPAIAGAWLFVLGSLLVGLHGFYAAPPIFAYDPFGGYFAGTLYDEDIAVPDALLWARAYHGALALAALAALEAARRRRLRAVLVAAAATVAAIGLHSRSGELGFKVSADDIAGALGGRVETEHFVIVYPKGAPFEPDLAAIARDHELRLAQAARAFGVATDGVRITSFYFGTREEKARWMGARDAYIAKPWRREMYLAHEELPHGSLRHEIAHVLAGGFGDPLFGVSLSWWGWPPAFFNVGLIEGAAVAADWPTRARLSPHEAARAMLELGMLPPVSTILAPGFFLFSSARSYTTAGSFVHFLLERHGADRFRALYRSGGRDGDFERLYGAGMAELEAAWRREIAALPLPAEEREIARERYRRPGIFRRPCPHALARLDRLAERRVAAGRADLAVPLLQRACAEDPAEPARRLPLAGALERAGRAEEAAGLLGALGGSDELSTPLRARALLRLVDLEARRGDRQAARRAAEAALTLPVDDATRRNLLLRRRALDPARPESDALAGYLFADDDGDPDPVLLAVRARAVEAASPGLGRYLTGRLLYGRSAWTDAARALGEAHALGLDEPLVARENDRLLVTAAYLAGDLAGARAAALRMAAADQPPEVRRAGQDWLARIDFAGK